MRSWRRLFPADKNDKLLSLQNIFVTFEEIKDYTTYPFFISTLPQEDNQSKDNVQSVVVSLVSSQKNHGMSSLIEPKCSGSPLLLFFFFFATFQVPPCWRRGSTCHGFWDILIFTFFQDPPIKPLNQISPHLT